MKTATTRRLSLAALAGAGLLQLQMLLAQNTTIVRTVVGGQTREQTVMHRGTSPAPDSDGDGYDDDQERALGTDPTDPASKGAVEPTLLSRTTTTAYSTGYTLSGPGLAGFLARTTTHYKNLVVRQTVTEEVPPDLPAGAWEPSPDLGLRTFTAEYDPNAPDRWRISGQRLRLDNFPDPSLVSTSDMTRNWHSPANPPSGAVSDTVRRISEQAVAHPAFLDSVDIIIRIEIEWTLSEPSAPVQVPPGPVSQTRAWAVGPVVARRAGSDETAVDYVVVMPTGTTGVVRWLEIFTPADGTAVQVSARAWTVGAGETKSPAFTLSCPADGQAEVLLTPGALLVDSNRDGVIPFPGDESFPPDPAPTAAQPFRFWINDDDDTGDISATGPSLIGNPDEPGRLAGFWELDGRTPDHAHSGVDGRSDLLDFFPVFLDIKALLGVLPPSTAGINYKLKQADSALNFVYTNLTRAEAFDYLKYNKERIAYGLPSDQRKAHEAPTTAITAAGVPLDADFLALIKDEADKGVILVEGRLSTTQPLRLIVEKDRVEIAEVVLPLKISEVEKMYRWINIRGATGQSVTRATDVGEPAGYPDNVTNGKMFIFVHGYNVNERDSRAWNAEAFKRMWQSGSRAMFTAVSWNGDYSQIPVVGVTPDYWDNITRAFQTAQALTPIVNGLPGSSNIIAGHSMGNVVVSAAVVDCGMNVDKFLMVDAAVALEAFDSSALAVDAMRHPDWASYTDRRLWPTDWHNLFPFDDGRRGLTWMNRFGNIANAVNIYSSGEEVLNNNDVTPGQIPPVSAERVWIIQEMAKGTTHLAALLTFDIQGGWGFNGEWRIGVTTTTGGPHGNPSTTYRNRTPAEAATLTDAQLREEPFFRRFQNANFRSPTGGSAAAADYVARANALGGAIPALSFPAGRNPVPLFGNTRNRDLMDVQDGWPQERFEKPMGFVPGLDPPKGRWWHSDIKNIAYVFNRGAWELFVNEGNLK